MQNEFDEVLILKASLNQLSDEFLMMIEQRFKEVGLTAKNYLLVIEVLNETLTKLLVRHTSAPEKIMQEYVIPSLLDHLAFEVGGMLKDL